MTILRHLCVLVLLMGLAPAEEEQPLPFRDMAPHLGRILGDNYYDRSRFRPRVMVERGLRALEAADVAIETTWEDGELTVAIAEDVNVLPAPVPADIEQSMDLLEQVRLLLDHDRYDPKRQRELAYAMLNGALGSLDPHTVIFPPEPADDFAEEIEGEFFGIGAYLSQQDGLITIDRVMPGLPADLAGVEDGDIILGVDGEKTVGLSLSQTVRRIKGPKGTKVVLTVEREHLDEPLDIEVIRDRIRIITMRSYRQGDVGYVRMDEFNRNTASQLFNLLAMKLQQRGPLKAFVLDLRFNSGGLLSQAKMISDFFLGAEKEIVRTVSPGQEDKPYHSSPQMLLKVPMVVITGSGSASAAEILAGSLQLNDRAVVMGNTTFGKGSVQTITPLPDESNLKITIQEYQLKGGVSIQERGVEPDVLLMRHSMGEDGSVDLLPYSLRREADDEFALRDRGTYRHDVAHRLGWVQAYRSREAMRRHSIASADFSPDQEAAMVIDLVAGAVAGLDQETVADALAAGTMRQAMLEALADPIAARAEVEADRLAEALATNPGLTWGEATPVAEGQMSLRFDGPETVTAGEDVAFTFAAVNAGEEAVGRLYGLVAADEASPFWEEEVVFGEAPGDGEATGVMRFPIPPRVYDGDERFVLKLFQLDRVEPLAELPVTVHMRSLPRPSLAYDWTLVDAGGDGQLQLDERATLRISLLNTGDGNARPLTVYVFKDDDHFVQLGEGRFVTDPLPAGGRVDLDVPITVRSSVTVGRTTHRYDGEVVRLLLRADEDFEERVDGRYRASLFHALEIPIDDELAPRTIAQPRMELLGVERLGDRARVKVRVTDDNLSFVSLFHDEDKVALQPADELEDGSFTAEVDLTDGVNSVRVMATDADDVIEVLPLRLWHKTTEQAKADPAAEREVVGSP